MVPHLMAVYAEQPNQTAVMAVAAASLAPDGVLAQKKKEGGQS
jgi:hypothetical protein